MSAPQNAATTSLLQMSGVSKTFFGMRALRDARLDVRAGEIHALMGENGAGKSTLMKILSGAYQADPGAVISVDGHPVRIDGPLAARSLGIAVIYQELSLAPNLTVAENIHLGREPARSGLVDRGAMNRDAAPVLTRLGARFRPSTLVGDLSIADRQLVEIGRALHARSRILVMDEPTTALSSRETDRLFQTVRQLRDEGLAIVYISHRMNEIYDLSDRVTVLRDGQYVGTLQSRAEIDAPTIVKMMVGRDLSTFYKKEHAAAAGSARPARPVVLEVQGFGDGTRLHDCSLAVHAGEVLGLAGLVGAGRTELALSIFGARPITTGALKLEGRPLAVRRPGDAIRAGLAYLTEDRKARGLFLDMSVAGNINLAVIGQDSAGGVLDLRAARRRALAAIKALAIRVAGPAVEVGSLSGGNQQKVLLSRLLETKPRVLILDEPTRGVDIGAKSEIYRIIDALAKQGVGVLVISSELPEIIGVCDRVVVMREGRIEGEVGGLDGVPVTQENIMALATKVATLEAA